MDRLIKSLPERKRRTFLRYMKKGKESETADGVTDTNGSFYMKQILSFDFILINMKFFRIPIIDTNENDDAPIKTKYVTFVPHNRQNLLDKIESLKLAEDDDDDFSFCDSDVDSDFDDCYDGEYEDDVVAEL